MSRGQSTELVSVNHPLTIFLRGISPRFAYFTCHFSGATLLWALLFQLMYGFPMLRKIGVYLTGFEPVVSASQTQRDRPNFAIGSYMV